MADHIEDCTIRCDSRSTAQGLPELLAKRLIGCTPGDANMLSLLIRQETANGLSSANPSELEKSLAGHSFRIVSATFDESARGHCRINLPSAQISVLTAPPGTTLVISSRIVLRLEHPQTVETDADRVIETVHWYHCSEEDRSILSAFTHPKGPKELGLLVRSKHALPNVKGNLCSLATTIHNDKTGQSITVVLDKSVWVNPDRAEDLMKKLQEEVNEHLQTLSGGTGAELGESVSITYLLSDPEDPSVYGAMIREDIHIQEKIRS